MWHAYSGLSGGRYRRYLSLREGSETEPERPGLYTEIIHLRRKMSRTDWRTAGGKRRNGDPE